MSVTDEDWRGQRRLLPPEALEMLKGGDALRPTAADGIGADPVDPETWRGIVALPDDVSLRTSEQQGRVLRDAQAAWRHWLGLVVDIQRTRPDIEHDALVVATMSVAEELQASLYNALTGFYRQAIGMLRAPVEAMLAAADFSARPDPQRLAQWLQGREEGRISVPKVRRALRKLEPYVRFEQEADSRLLGDDGWLTWLYGVLCAFVHGRPALTDAMGTSIETTNGGMWQSNGPVYAPRAFTFWSTLYFDSLLACALLAGLTEPRIIAVAEPSDIGYEQLIEHLMDWHPHPGPPPPAAAVAEHLMPSR